MEVHERGVASLFVTTVVLSLVGLFLIAALINQAFDLTILCLLVFALSGLLKLWTKLSASEVGAVIESDKRRLFAGESFVITLRAENRSIIPFSFEARIPVGRDLKPVSGEDNLSAVNSLLWFQSIRIEWELSAGRRGVHAVGPARLATGDLLGFFVKESRPTQPIEIVIYPRLTPLRPLSLPRHDFFGIPGGEGLIDDPVYILGTVDYHYGRPAKHIHWKASARHHRLQQKVFESTQQEKVLLVVDAAQFAEQNAHEAFEKTLEVVASLAVRLDRQGCATGLLTNALLKGASPVVPVTRNPLQVGTILDTLARILMEQGTAVAKMLGGLGEVPWGTTCVYFALDRTPDTDLARAYFSRRRTPLLFFTYAAVLELSDESAIRHTGTPPLESATTGAFLQ